MQQEFSKDRGTLEAFVYDEKMLPEIDRLDAFLGKELRYHQDILPDTATAIFEGDRMLAAGFLSRNPGDRFVALEFALDREDEQCIEASALLFEILVDLFLEYREACREEVILRLWARESMSAYREFLDSFDFVHRDTMLVYERALGDEARGPADFEVVSVDLEDPAALGAYLAGTKEAFGYSDSGEEMLFRIRHCGARVFGAKKGGKTAAFVTTWPLHGAEGERIAATENIFCLENYRRQGLTEGLLRSLFRTLDAEGYKGVRLNVYANDAPAITLYEKLGYIKKDTYLEYHLEVQYE